MADINGSNQQLPICDDVFLFMQIFSLRLCGLSSDDCAAWLGIDENTAWQYWRIPFVPVNMGDGYPTEHIRIDINTLPNAE